MAYLLDKMEAKKMTDIYERMADRERARPRYGSSRAAHG